MNKFRVECNFGSKYFDKIEPAIKHFNKCKDKGLNVQIWSIVYVLDESSGMYLSQQILLDYYPIFIK